MDIDVLARDEVNHTRNLGFGIVSQSTNLNYSWDILYPFSVESTSSFCIYTSNLLAREICSSIPTIESFTLEVRSVEYELSCWLSRVSKTVFPCFLESLYSTSYREVCRSWPRSTFAFNEECSQSIAPTCRRCTFCKSGNTTTLSYSRICVLNCHNVSLEPVPFLSTQHASNVCQYTADRGKWICRSFQLVQSSKTSNTASCHTCLEHVVFGLPTIIIGHTTIQIVDNITMHILCENIGKFLPTIC